MAAHGPGTLRRMDALPCPRCGGPLDTPDYGPCPACVTELRATQRQEAREIEAVAFEPAMHVTPNAVALKEYLERQSPNVDSIITSTGQRDQAELATFHLDAGRRAFEREADREAERELRRALYLSPYLAAANMLLGRIHLRAGRPADAIQAFKLALWSEESAAGHVALAEAYLQSQNVEGAKEEIDRALALDPNSATARALRDKLPK